MILKNKFLTAFCAVLLMVLFAGCTGKNKVEEEPQETMTLSGADTTKVVELMNQYFDLLLNKDFDGALSMEKYKIDAVFVAADDMEYVKYWFGHLYKQGRVVVVPRTQGISTTQVIKIVNGDIVSQ